MYTEKTIKDTQRILDLLVKNPQLTDERLRDITEFNLHKVKHAIRRLKMHGNIKTEKLEHDYQYKRILTILDPVFGGVEDVK